jgi:hypothetical protein
MSLHSQTQNVRVKCLQSYLQQIAFSLPAAVAASAAAEPLQHYGS